MAEHVGLVVTDGRVLLGSGIEELQGLTIIPRDVRLDGQTLHSSDHLNTIRGQAGATDRRRTARILPPQREQFLQTYLGLAKLHAQVVSIHYLATLDGAAREARVCRQLMQPLQQIEVYEAKALEGGLAFLLRTATTLTQQGASPAQLLALLRYLETHMQTFLLTPNSAQRQPWVTLSMRQRWTSLMPGVETLWHLDPKQRKLVVAGQGIQLHARIGQLLQQRCGTLRYDAVLRPHGYDLKAVERLAASLQAAGIAAVRVEPATATFLPCLPQSSIEVLLLPVDSDLRRLQALVQDPIWWKGGAA